MRYGHSHHFQFLYKSKCRWNGSSKLVAFKKPAKKIHFSVKIFQFLIPWPMRKCRSETGWQKSYKHLFNNAIEFLMKNLGWILHMYQGHIRAKKLRWNISWKLILPKMTVENWKYVRKSLIDIKQITVNVKKLTSHTSVLFCEAYQDQEQFH